MTRLSRPAPRPGKTMPKKKKPPSSTIFSMQNARVRAIGGLTARPDGAGPTMPLRARLAGIRIHLTLLPGALALLVALADTGLALPPGRDWTPLEAFRVPGHTRLLPLWMDTDTTGNPVVFAAAVGGIGRDTYGCHWTDSTWAVSWVGGFATGLSWPVLSPRGTRYLLWKSVGDAVETPTGTKSRLVLSEAFSDHLGEHDTLGLIWASAVNYAAAAGSKRRWVVVQDFTDLRLFYSDTLRSWREVEVAGQGEGGVGVAALDDTTAIVAWAGLNEGVRWGVLRGGTWNEGPALDHEDRLADRPHFTPRLSGGHWLAWGTGGENFVPIRTFRRGVWSEPESLRCAYPYPEDHWTSSPDVSRDGGEYPAVSWIETNPTGRQTICVCMPTDAGFTVADHLPFRGLPTIARDRNGDVWVAWWDAVTITGMFWLHTYNRATASDLRIEGHGRHRRVAWTLSEPAPETWWAVLRASGAGDFVQVARVRAGPGLGMSWADTSPPAGLLRYRVRRESVDTRYLWESPEVRLPEKGRGLAVRLLRRLPQAQQGELELENAAPGLIDLRIFDVQGRKVHRQQGVAGGTGHDTIAFDLASTGALMPNGVYFAVVRDASGQVSPAVRMVVLR